MQTWEMSKKNFETFLSRLFYILEKPINRLISLMKDKTKGEGKKTQDEDSKPLLFLG